MSLEQRPQEGHIRLDWLGLIVALGLLALSLLWMGGTVWAGSAISAPWSRDVDTPSAEIRVCPAGPPACDYASVQAAVDAAGAGDVIKVAAGTYSGVQSRPAPPGYLSGPATINQVVYLDKALSIQGGYTTGNWATPDPLANPTVLDAQGQGRVLFIGGDVSPLIAGLHLTGGDAAGLGGHPWGGGSDTGGGVQVLTATATISHCWVYGNAAAFGGGIYFDRSDGTVRNSEVTTNTANWGGGLSLRSSSAQILDNIIANNTVVASGSPAPSGGGGMDVATEGDLAATLVIQHNTISGNQADHQGGGISFRGGVEATVSDNLISANTAITGGGVYLWENYVTLSGNTLSENTATSGGGVAIVEGASILDGNTIRTNTASDSGGGVYIDRQHYQGVGPTLTGNTVQDNGAISGGGLATRIADVTIRSNTFTGNQASGGGGLDLFSSSDTIVAHNLIRDNWATNDGGGINVGMFDGTLEGNRIIANRASNHGGGARVFGGGTWTNNVIADNQAGGHGSALYMVQGNLELRHTTIARNSGGDGSAVYLTAAAPIPGPSRATLINSILSDHNLGIGVTAGNTATVDAVLWFNTPTKVDAEPGASVSLQNEHTGNPAFDADGYHLTAGSAALDKGIDAGVNLDMDGEPRPMLWGPDLGADELPGAHLASDLTVSPQYANPGTVVAYTAIVTSGGVQDATGVELTLSLDGALRPFTVDSSLGGCSIPDAGWGGSAVCTPGTLPPSSVVVMTVTAEVATGASIGQEMIADLSAQANEMTSSAQATVVAQDCHVRLNDATTDYATVQAAVDSASPGDLVKVAGTCLGVYERAGLFQQVYLYQDLTLRGGYATGNWAVSDPEANPTTLDATHLGRVIHIPQGISSTIEGLRITHGDASGQGGGRWGQDSGGGVYAITSTVTLRDNSVEGNTAERGGGCYLRDSSAALGGNRFTANEATGYGGGVVIRESQASITSNTISTNTAAICGGLCLLVSDGSLDSNIVSENMETGGGALGLISSQATLTNNVIADNYAETGRSGIELTAGSFRLVHNTIARNRGPAGCGIHITENRNGEPTTVILSNTILVSHSVGLSVTGVNTVTVNGVLWHDTPSKVNADPGALVSLQNEVSGHPMFEADGYHLTIRSAAIDRGVDTGLLEDIDGEPRPRGATYDLGADETDPVADVAVSKIDETDPVIVGHPVTYTLQVANNGPAGATGVFLTDTLPFNAIYSSSTPQCGHSGGVITCNVGALVPGATETFTVAVTPPDTGQLINLVEARASELDPNPTNNEYVEYTAVVPVPPPGPEVTGVRPESAVRTQVTPITIEGDRFQDGAAARLAGQSLGPVTWVNAQRLLAAVPSGLPGGTHDLIVTNPDGQSGTLPGAFTVLTPGPPTLTSSTPGQGPNDTPVMMELLGANFSPEMTAVLRLGGESVPLVDLVFIDSTRFQAAVPVSTTSGLYDLVVTNPDDQSAELASAYQVLEPAASNDLYAVETDLWLDPPSIHARETLTLGLTLRRQGGQADLHDVDVLFYLEEGEPSFETTAPLLPPRGSVTVTAEWAPQTEGAYVLYAQIDPADEVPENDPANNLISRTLTVLPPLPDITPPTVDGFAINGGGGWLYTYYRNVKLDTSASDDPDGWGVAHLYFVEYVFSTNQMDWQPIRSSGWLPYDEASTGYSWQLADYVGAHFLQVWAADAAGNVSIQPGSQMINYSTSYHRWIYTGQVHLYRQPMEAGQELYVSAETGFYQGSQIGLIVWRPDGTWAARTGLYGSYDSERFRIPVQEDGVYQIEVRGWGQRSEYRLTIVPLEFSSSHQPANKLVAEGEEQPAIPPGSEPSRFIGLPSVPVVKVVYLPLVLRNLEP